MAFESQTGLLWISGSATNSLCWTSQLMTPCSKYQEFVNCIAVAQVTFVLTVSLSMIESAGHPGRYLLKYKIQNGISYTLHPLILKRDNFLIE